MPVRKRTWTTAKGEQREAWIVDYRDRQGDRHIETFDRKKDADAKHAEVRIGVRAGVPISRMKTEELDRLVAAGTIRAIDRERVRFIVRRIVQPPHDPTSVSKVLKTTRPFRRRGRHMMAMGSTDRLAVVC